MFFFLNTECPSRERELSYVYPLDATTVQWLMLFCLGAYSSIIIFRHIELYRQSVLLFTSSNCILLLTLL
jgi:hypothetical protein